MEGNCHARNKDNQMFEENYSWVECHVKAQTKIFLGVRETGYNL